MVRSKKFKKREVLKDSVFENAILHKLVNCIMRKGKKFVAYKLIKQAFEIVEKEINENAVKVFFSVLEKIKPEISLRKKKVASSTYHIPVEILPERGYSFGIRWIIMAANQRKDNSFSERLAKEIIDIYKFNKGEALKLKEKVYKLAEHNRAFAHYL